MVPCPVCRSSVADGPPVAADPAAFPSRPAWPFPSVMSCLCGRLLVRVSPDGLRLLCTFRYSSRPLGLLILSLPAPGFGFGDSRDPGASGLGPDAREAR